MYGHVGIINMKESLYIYAHSNDCIKPGLPNYSQFGVLPGTSREHRGIV